VVNLKRPALEAFPFHYPRKCVAEWVLADHAHAQGFWVATRCPGGPFNESHEIEQECGFDLIFARSLGAGRESPHLAHSQEAEKDETNAQEMMRDPTPSLETGTFTPGARVWPFA
jgi:hypothetical protein